MDKGHAAVTTACAIRPTGITAFNSWTIRTRHWVPITLIKNKGGVTDHHAPGRRKNSCYFLQNPSYFLSSGNSSPRQINWLDRHKNSVFSSLFLCMCLPAQGEKHFYSKTKYLSLQHPCSSLRGFVRTSRHLTGASMASSSKGKQGQKGVYYVNLRWPQYTFLLCFFI